MPINLDSLFLMVGLINGLLIASLLVLRSNNKTANLILAAMILLLVLRVVVFIAGSNGIYDPHSWLYVPPVEFSLAYGPLILAYVQKLTKLPLVRFWPHLIPFMIQATYYFVLLALPASDSIQWIQQIHFTWIVDTESLLVIISMTVYLYLSWQRYLRYQHALQQQRSDGENFRLPWLFGFLLATSLSLLVMATFSAFGFWLEFSYSQHFWLFASQSLLLFYLSLESWRHCDLVLPTVPINTPPHHKVEAAESIQIKLKAELWLKTIIENNWWQNPEITLENLAKKLGSNTSTVSKVLNNGLEKNFSTLINELRVEAICRRLDQGLDEGGLLKIAFQYGFNSKNSFNRNFKKITGYTPRQYRQSKAPNHKLMH